MMDNGSSVNRDNLDEDIMQCRADILRSRNRSEGPAPVTPEAANLQTPDVAENPFRRTNVVAGRVSPFLAKKADTISEVSDTPPVESSEKKVRIPLFEELIMPVKRPVEAQWETPLEVQPEAEIEDVVIDQGNVEQVIEVSDDLDILVTAEEEAAIFSDTDADQSQQEDPKAKELAIGEGFDALRRVVAEANTQEQLDVEELQEIKGIEEMIGNEEGDGFAIEKVNIEAEADDTDILVNAADTSDTTDLNDFLDSVHEITEDTPLSNDSETVDWIEATEEMAAVTQEPELIADDPKTVDAPKEVEESNVTCAMIPKFDLAEQILKEQRQVASNRRQRPAASRNLNVMPIAGTVGQIIEEAKRAVLRSAKKKESLIETQSTQPIEEVVKKKALVFDKIEIEKIEDDHCQPVLSVAACQIVNDSDRLNPFQEDIIIEIVSRDIAQFCGEF